MSTPEDDQWRQLALVASELSGEVANLREAEEKQAKEFKALRKEVEKKNYRTTIKLRVMVTLLVVDLFLSGAMVIGYLKISDLIKHEEIVRSQVLCPLYRIFVSSYNPDSLAAKSQGIDTYNRNFADINDQFGALDCPPAPPR